MPTLTFKTLYELVFIASWSPASTTATNPTAAWIYRQVIEATPWGCKPWYLLHEATPFMDGISASVPGASASTPMALRSTLQKPNVVVERVIGNLRREWNRPCHRP